MQTCPACGRVETYNSVTCSHCHYTFRYDDRADYELQDIVFTVSYRCRNCHRTFKHGFGVGDEVRPKGSGERTVSADRQTGQPYLEVVDGHRCQPRCPTCENDTCLSIRERRPVRER